MAEGSKGRLVRCPRCGNLLEESPEFSVYKCGACETILQAKKRDPRSDVLSENSDEEKGLVGSEKLESLAEKGTEMEDNGSETNWRRKDRDFVEKKADFGNRNFQRTEKQEILVREDIGFIGRDFKDLRLERSVGETDQRTPGANRRLEINGSHSVNPSIEEMSNQQRRVAGSLRTRPRMDWSGLERGRFDKRAPNIPYEGPSNYDPYSFHAHSHPANVPGEVEQLELERAELLRKLDELKEQLSRSYHVADNVAIQKPSADHFVNRHNNNVDARNFCPPPVHNPNMILEYDDPFQPQMTRKPLNGPPYQYPPHVSPREYYMGRQYRNFDPHENFFHAPTCSCLSCYNLNLRVPPQVPRFQGAPVNLNSNFYHHEDPVMIGPQGFPLPRSRDLRRHARWSVELEPENDGFGHPRSRVVASNKTSERRYRPFAGGAPFITCIKCFELLKLPRKKLRTANNFRQELRCGACSALILLELENSKKLVVSDAIELKHTPTAEDEQSSSEVLNESIVSSGSLNANCASSCSEDIKNSNFNFQSAVTEHSSLVEEDKEERLNSDEPEKTKKVYSSSPSVSSREDVRESVDFPLKAVSSPVPPRSPMWQESDSPRRAIGRYGLGNTSKRSENENDDEKAYGRRVEDSVRNDELEATELDVSFDEYQHNSMSQDFVEMSKEEDYPMRLSKGGDSFLVGFIKRSLRDFSRSSHSVETEKPKVYINGHPLRDRVVKSAEMFAGPIRPGDYWYDYKAGFWGVMGQPCLGIIPPRIKEFNYPMPTNCGAGNTGVYVNGRELNQRDLDLLASRGLPTMRDKFYIVEINGKVFDEGTGKEVYSLGKLAPTVEKAKHGFGMKVPRAVS